MVRETKLYDALGVSTDASPRDIKMAYHRLAQKFHPDKVQGTHAEKEEAAAKFKDIGFAYEILSDEEKRPVYDRYGLEAVQQGGGPSRGGMGGDPMSMFFGGGGGRRQRENKPKDIVHPMEVQLQDFYKGRSVRLAITRNRFCPSCKGSGCSKPGMTVICQACRGKGARIVVVQMGPGMITQMEQTCDACKGTGKVIDPKFVCKECNGAMVKQTRDVFDVVIEPGSKEGDTFKIVGAGDQEPGKEGAGDIVILFKEKAHPVFKRYGKYLLVEQPVSLADALCGFHLLVTHLDGRHLSIKSTPGQVLKPDSMYSVHHEGMPSKGSGGSNKGDLLVKINIVFPQAVNPKSAQVLREVLGPMKKAVIKKETEWYETHMQDTRLTMDDLAGQDQQESDDDGVPAGAQRVQCASQ